MVTESQSVVEKFLDESRKHEQAGNLSEAIKFARNALSLALEHGDDERAGKALTACAQAFFRLGQYDSCQDLVDQALTRVSEESVVRVDGLRIMGVCALETNRISDGERYLREAIKLSRQIGCDEQLARCLHNLSAGVYMPRGQFDLSLQADQEALRICRKFGFSDLLWGPLLTQAWVRWLNGESEISRELVDELEKVVHPGSLGEGYVHLLHAHLAMDSGDFSAAETALQRTFTLTETLGIPELQIFGRLARSRYLRLINQLADAFAWAEDGFKIAVDIGYRHMESTALIEKGRLDWLIGRWERALSWLHQAAEILDGLELHFDATRAILILAAIEHQQNNPHAVHTWIEAVRRILQGGFISLVTTETDVVKPLIAAFEQPGGILLERMRALPPPPLRVVTFGGLRVWVGEREIDPRELKRRRGSELLVLLLLSPGYQLQVEQVIEALLPGIPPTAAQSSFHQATSGLRRALEPDLPDKLSSRYLKVEDGQVIFVVPPGSRVDFQMARAYSRSGEWQKVLTLSRGEFLPEMLYLDWTVLHRQRFNDMVQFALLEQARKSFLEGNYIETLEHCWRIIDMEPWHEEAVLLGMKAYMGLGDRSAARRLYHQLEKTFKTELQSEPSEELRSYFHRSVLQKNN